MSPTLPPGDHAADAVSRAQHTRVVVIGGGIAGLVAAWEWAKIGAAVTLLEASDRLGGCIETATLDGLPVDLVADALPGRDAALGALLSELGLDDLREAAAPHPLWLTGIPGTGAAPMPDAEVLGVPANPWAADVRRVIGWAGAWRAYLDRLRPPLTVGHERSLGRLVRTRMGARVAERLVAPAARGIYGAAAEEVDVDVAAPGLNAALTRTGSLAGAVAENLPADAAPHRITLRGGLSVLVDALAERLDVLGGDVRLATPALAVSPVQGDGATWKVQIAEVPTLTDPAEQAEPAESAAFLSADIVVVATEAATAVALLQSAGVAIDAADAVGPDHLDSARDVVTLAVSSPSLDAAPRGRGVLPLPEPAAPLLVAHVSADWPSVAGAAGGGRHIVRVVFAAEQAGEQPADRTEAHAADLVTRAHAAAGDAFGFPLGAVREVATRRVAQAEPASRLGHRARAEAVRRAVADRPGLQLVGAWVAGSGIAHTVTDAITEVERARRELLWGSADPLPTDAEGH